MTTTTTTTTDRELTPEELLAQIMCKLPAEYIVAHFYGAAMAAMLRRMGISNMTISADEMVNGLVGPARVERGLGLQVNLSLPT